MPLDVNTFADKIKTKYPQYKDVDNLELAKKIVEKYPQYKEQVTFEEVKKKEATESATEDGSLDTPQVETQKPSESLDLGESGIPMAKIPIKVEEEPKLINNVWYMPSKSELSDKKVYNIPVNDPEKVNALNKKYNKKASTSEVEQIFTGYPGKETNEYRVVGNSWERRQKGKKDWTEVKNEGSINALNREFKKDITYPKYRSAVIDEIGEKKEAEKKALNESLSKINKDLINSSESDVKRWIENNFPGFGVEEQGLGVDNILVKAPSGAKISIPLDDMDDEDNNASAIKLREFLKVNSNQELFDASSRLIDAEEARKELISKQIRESRLDGKTPNIFDRIDADRLIEQAEEDKFKSAVDIYRTLYTQKDFEGGKEAIASLPKDKKTVNIAKNKNEELTLQYKDYKKDLSGFIELQSDLDKKYSNGEISDDERTSILKTEQEKLINKNQELQKNLNDLNIFKQSIDKSIAANTFINESQGDFAGGMYKKFVSGATSLLRPLASMSKEEQQNLVQDIVGNATTNEYTDSEKRSDLAKAMFSLSESMGVALPLAPMGTLATGAGFFSQSFYEMKDDLDTVEGISDDEKLIMSTGYGIVSALLENVGLGAITGKFGKDVTKGISMAILKKTFKELPKDASREVLEGIISKNVKMMIADAGITIGGASITEGSTEFLQKMSQEGIKEAYDIAKSTDKFHKTEGFWDVVKEAAYEGKLGAIGGGIMRGASNSAKLLINGRNIAADKKKLDKEYNSLVAIVTDENEYNSHVEKIKLEIKEGTLTAEEGKQELDVLSESRNIISQIPEGLSTRKSRKAAELIKEKNDITSAIEGKDKALVSSQTERINAINEELAILGQDEETDTTTDGDVQPGVESSDTQEQDTDIQETIDTETSEEQVERKQDEGSIDVNDTDVVNMEEATIEELDSTKMDEFKKPVKFKDYTINLQKGVNKSNTPYLEFIIKDKSNELIGFATFWKDKDGVWYANNINLFKKKDKRKGIMTFIYNSLISNNVPLKPSKEQTEEGIAFWDSLSKKTEPTIDQAKQYKGQKALDWLDSFESKLDDITDPKNLNDATRVIPAMALKGIIKALKASIKAGMTVGKAIDKYFNENTEYTKEEFELSISKPSKVKPIITESVKDEKKAFKEGKKEGKAETEEKLKPLIAKLKEFKSNQAVAKKYILEKIKEFEGKKVLNARAVLNRLMRVNLNNPKAVADFIEYADKAFKNAAYIDRINAIIKMNKSSKKKSKNQQGAVKDMAKRLASIDPVMVEDLDELEAISMEVNLATKSGLKEPADVKKINEYIDKVEAEIKEKKRLNLLGEFSELVNDGILNKNSTYEEILQVIEGLESNESVDNKSVSEKKAELLQRFNNQKIAAQMAMKESETELAKNVIKEALDIDITKLSISDAYKLVTAIDNFIVNDFADGLGPIVNKSIGIKNAEKFSRLKYIAPSFNMITRTFANYYSSIPLLADTMFGGVKKGAAFLRMSGFNLMQRMSVIARMNAKKINDNYVTKFYKTMPNGEKFFSVNNIFERGVIADILRTDGDPGDFKRKKDLLFQSAEALLKGNKEEVKKGESYKEVFEKIGLEKAESIDDLNVDPINTKAVRFWIKEWSKIYDDLKELNSVVYNTNLENDIDYTTKRMSMLSYKDKRITEADIKEASSLALDLGILSAQAGTLKEVTRPSAIKNRYVDLDFDMSQSKSMLASQLDLKTTDVSQQIKGFLNSEEFNKSFDKTEDAAMFRNRMSDYVNMTRMKKGFSNSKESKAVMDAVGVLSKLSTRWTLGGVAAIPKQTIPVFTNTFINTINEVVREGKIKPPDLFFKGLINPLMSKSSMNAWIEKNDLPINIRGLESRTVIERSDNLLKDSKAKSKFKKVGESIDKIWLEKFLGNSDVYAARSSFMTYYLQSLRNQGKTTKVNWDNHKPNEKAVEYAQHMVDRQQNISDVAAAGKLFSSDKNAVKFLRQILFPFASFTVNSKAKLFADVRALTSQDRKEYIKIIKSGKIPKDVGAPLLSILATVAEISMFQIIGVYLKDLYDNLITGREEDEEDEEKIKKRNKERLLKQTLSDVVSPAPAVDFMVLGLINSLYEKGYKYTFDENDPEYKELLDEEMSKYEYETKEVKEFKEEEFKRKYQDEDMLDLSNTWEATDLDKFGSLSIPIEIAQDLSTGLSELNKGYYEKEFLGKPVRRYFTKEQAEINREILGMKLLRFVIPDQTLRNLTNIYDRENRRNALNSNQYQEYIKLDKKASEDEVMLIKKGYDSIDIKDYIRTDVKGLNDKQKKTYFEVMRKGKKSDVFTNKLTTYIKKGYSVDKILEKLER